MGSQERLPSEIQDVLNKGLLKRLPLTIRPFVNDSIRDWDHMFPFERQSFLRFVRFLGGLDEGQFTALFRGLRELEAHMGVSRWESSVLEQTTMENASLLARSPYFQEWRREIDKVFGQVDQHTPSGGSEAIPRNRLVLLILPRRLPLEPSQAWRKWQGKGRELRLDLADLGETRSTAEILLGGSSREGDRPQPGLLDVYAQRATRAAHEFWVLDAGAGWSGVLPRLLPPDASVTGVTFLSFERLKTFRENFLQRLNTMAKDLADADAVSGYLRKADISKWCPPEVATEPGVQQFLRSVSFVNGALIYGNSFVEWTASEAFRRARPSVLVAQFGTRPKPKPLTSVAVFENQELASPLPSVEDIPGSAIDAQILARYVWLAAGRYPQYQSHSACVCISENLGVAYAVAPPGFPLGQEREPITLKRLSSVLNTWLT